MLDHLGITFIGNFPSVVLRILHGLNTYALRANWLNIQSVWMHCWVFKLFETIQKANTIRTKNDTLHS